jgi:hypothetical protein
MNKHIDTEEKLERLLTQALGSLPLRPAPRTLESRVMAALERRALRPWWHCSFAHWPVAPRIAFVLVCAALIAATFFGGVSAFLGYGSLNVFAALLLSWVQPLLAVMSSAGGLAALLVRVIPPLWLYGGLALGALLYVALFGLGAAAYRTLYLRPSMAGDAL